MMNSTLIGVLLDCTMEFVHRSTPRPIVVDPVKPGMSPSEPVRVDPRSVGLALLANALRDHLDMPEIPMLEEQGPSATYEDICRLCHRPGGDVRVPYDFDHSPDIVLIPARSRLQVVKASTVTTQ